MLSFLQEGEYLEENISKIKYISVSGKVYKVIGINWQHLTLKAEETGLSVHDVPEGELWDISELEEFKIRLVNSGSRAEIIDMARWLEEHGLRN